MNNRIGLLQARTINFLHLADGTAHKLRGAEHAGCVFECFKLPGLGVFNTFLQDAEHCLCQGKIARGGQGHGALARHGDNMQLAEGGDVVQPGIGARVRHHHHAVSDQNASAICHEYPRSAGGLATWWASYNALGVKMPVFSADVAP
jgi:hypothetical protein